MIFPTFRLEVIPVTFRSTRFDRWPRSCNPPLSRGSAVQQKRLSTFLLLPTVEGRIHVPENENKEKNTTKATQKNRCPKWQQHETNTTVNVLTLCPFNLMLDGFKLKPYLAKGPTALVRPIGPVVFGLEIAFGSTTRAPAKRCRAWNIWRNQNESQQKGVISLSDYIISNFQ